MPTLTRFRPQEHGFHFANNFVNVAATLNLPGINQKIVTRGRCGGMAYASLDYFNARMSIPTHVAADFGAAGVPPDGTPLADYIYQRLFDTFVVPSAAKFVTFTLAKSEDVSPPALPGLPPPPVVKGVYSLSKDEAARIRQSIDQQQPVVVGLVGATSLEDVGGKNHQAVAYGYDGGQILIYDNNTPDQEVRLSFDDATRTIRATNGSVWRGLFVQDYASKTPTYTDLVITEGVTVSPRSVSPGAPLRATYKVRNAGSHRAHVKYFYLWVRGPGGENLDGLLGGVGTDVDVNAGAEFIVDKSCPRFGTAAGTYKIGASYYSKQGNWMDMKLGAGAVKEVEVKVATPRLVASAANADGRVELFYVGEDKALWHRWQEVPQGAFTGVESLGGVLNYGAAAACQADGRMLAFHRGTDNNLYYKIQPGPGQGPWQGWHSLGGVLSSDPQVVRLPNGKLMVVVIGADGLQWFRAQTSGDTWDDWRQC